MFQKLPCKECRGRCCTYPVFTGIEIQAVRAVHGVPKDATVQPIQHVRSYDPTVRKDQIGFMVHRADGTCPYLLDGKCSIYNLRPKVCKDYGVVPDLPCEYLYPEAAQAKQLKRIQESRI